MKKRIASIVIILVALLVPIVLVLLGFCSPAQFGETYSGELSYMDRRLRQTEGKKIVLIGNSALAFGLRSDLLASEFSGYSVVNFGLYGAIGTKTMLDLSRSAIREGDIVIVAPERNAQAQSLYFSASETWPAMDGAFSMLGRLKKENIGAMAGNYFGFLSRKFGYLTGGAGPAVSGVYQQSAFDDGNGREVGYMTYRRDCNRMAGGYDANNPIDFSEELQQDFLDYLNEYNSFVKKRGAALYYGFTPCNRSGLKAGTDRECLDAYCDRLRAALDFPVLGDPNAYVLDQEWFYDTNFHVNSAGMYVFTDRVAEDLKAELGIDEPNRIEIPEKPQAAPPRPSEGENDDEDYFLYEDFQDGVKIIGITEAARNRDAYSIPASHQGKDVICFDASVFSGNSTVREITVQANVRFLYDRSFVGCTALKRLILQHETPNSVGVGYTI